MNQQLLLKEVHYRIDHTALQPEVTEEDVKRLCAEAMHHRFHAVCVNPIWVMASSEELLGSGVQVVAVTGFPLGANRTDIKVAEAVECAEDGAREIDLVANIGWLCSDRFAEMEAEIRKVRRNLPPEIALKVIIETSKLTKARQIAATQIVIDAGAQFVKTGTGFFGGASVDDVRTLSDAARGLVAVKAAGGIRTLEDCRNMLEAGASRLGTSASVAIMNEYSRLYEAGAGQS